MPDGVDEVSLRGRSVRWVTVAQSRMSWLRVADCSRVDGAGILM